jgi:hypothetical protein
MPTYLLLLDKCLLMPTKMGQCIEKIQLTRLSFAGESARTAVCIVDDNLSLFVQL